MLVNGDIIDEEDQTFLVNLTNAANATIADGTGLGTILDDDDAPTIAIADASAGEGAGTVSLAVTLSGPSEKTITVDFATADGTAIGDYTTTGGTLTLAPGTTSQTISVPIVSDNLDESDESFVVDLSNATNATFADNQGLATILDDDTATLSIDDVTVTEGDSGTVAATFTVSLSNPSTQAVMVDFSTADGTATAPADYLAAGGSLTFAPGVTTQTITVQVNGDVIDEDDQNFLVNLVNAVSAAIADGQGLGTILDDDAAPTASIADASATEAPGGSTATFVVTLSAPSEKTIAVDFATADGTAVAPGDYTAGGGTLTFAPGVTSQNITVAVADDLLDEDDETFSATLSNLVNVSPSDVLAIGTIIDDDPPVSISINDVSQFEGTGGTTSFVFTVSLSSPSGKTVTVDFATAPDSATLPDDFIAAAGLLPFTPGVTFQTVTVSVNPDGDIELDEAFFVDLTNPTNATLADAQGLGAILNDDALAVVTLSINDVTVTEPDAGSVNATFTVTLSAPSLIPVLVDFATADGTAAAGVDYTATSGTLLFGPGETSKTIEVPVLGDLIFEHNEIFHVNLSNATGAAITDGQGEGKILDNDPKPTLAISDVSVTEGDSGTINAIFVVTLTGPTEVEATVEFATGDGTATAPDDYAAGGGTLTFAPGVTSQTVTVLVNGDLIDEVDETFFVTLSNAAFADITDGQGIGTIVDDDPVVVAINDVSVTEGDAGSTNAIFTVTLSRPAIQTITVDFSTADGTATAGADYTAGAGTLTFLPGETSKIIIVPVLDDLLDENDETFLVNLANATNAAIGDGQGVGTIIDNDDPPSASISDVTVSEGLGGATAVFTITLSAPSGRGIDIGFTTLDGTATPPGDYETTSGTLHFDPGVTQVVLSVPVNDDFVDEDDETFTVELSSPVNVTIADGTGVGTIVDNDGPLVINGTNADDEIYVKQNGPLIVVWINANPNTDPPTLTRVQGGVTSIRVNTLEGEDEVTLDFGGGNLLPPSGIDLSGGIGADTLTFLGTGGGISGTVTVLDGATTLLSSANGLSLVLQDASTVNFEARQDLTALTLNDTSLATINPGANRALEVNALTIADGATLDVTDNGFVVHSDAANRVAVRNASNELAKRGYNGGTWTGTGITSSTAAANLERTVAVVLNDNGSGGTFQTTYNGVGVLTTNDIMVGHTVAGDQNMDKRVSIADYFILVVNFNKTNAVYQEGDINFDGTVSIADFFIQSVNFGKTFSSSSAVVATAPQGNAAKSSAVEAGSKRRLRSKRVHHRRAVVQR